MSKKHLLFRSFTLRSASFIKETTRDKYVLRLVPSEVANCANTCANISTSDNTMLRKILLIYRIRFSSNVVFCFICRQLFFLSHFFVFHAISYFRYETTYPNWHFLHVNQYVNWFLWAKRDRFLFPIEKRPLVCLLPWFCLWGSNRFISTPSIHLPNQPLFFSVKLDFPKICMLIFHCPKSSHEKYQYT